MTLHFSDNNQTNDNRGLYFQSPLVKLEPLNAVAKYNSLEAFDDGKYLSIIPRQKSILSFSWTTTILHNFGRLNSKFLYAVQKTCSISF